METQGQTTSKTWYLLSLYPSVLTPSELQKMLCSEHVADLKDSQKLG